MSGIHTAIIGMLTDIEAIGKDRECTQGARFRFRGIDDVYNAIHPLLATHKVFPTAKILEKHFDERESKAGGVLRFSILTVAYTFWHEDGSNVVTEVVGEAMDSGDKSCNKAMSVAYKYALFQLLCIPTETVDPDTEVHEPAPSAATRSPTTQSRSSGNIMAEPPPKLSPEEEKYIEDATQSFRSVRSDAEARELWKTVLDKPGPIKARLHPIYEDVLKSFEQSA